MNDYEVEIQFCDSWIENVKWTSDIGTVQQSKHSELGTSAETIANFLVVIVKLPRNATIVLYNALVNMMVLQQENDVSCRDMPKPVNM